MVFLSPKSQHVPLEIIFTSPKSPTIQDEHCPYISTNDDNKTDCFLYQTPSPQHHCYSNNDDDDDFHLITTTGGKPQHHYYHDDDACRRQLFVVQDEASVISDVTNPSTTSSIDTTSDNDDDNPTIIRMSTILKGGRQLWRSEMGCVTPLPSTRLFLIQPSSSLLPISAKTLLSGSLPSSSLYQYNNNKSLLKGSILELKRNLSLDMEQPTTTNTINRRHHQQQQQQQQEIDNNNKLQHQHTFDDPFESDDNQDQSVIITTVIQQTASRHSVDNHHQNTDNINNDANLVVTLYRYLASLLQTPLEKDQPLTTAPRPIISTT